MPIVFSNVRTLPYVDHGMGGTPFTCHAPGNGLALVGMRVRTGWWIDQVTPIFAELRDDGSLGAELEGPSFGGWGGEPRELRAMPGHVVTGLQTRSGNYIDAIRLQQTRWDGGLAGPASWTHWMTGSQSGGIERPPRNMENEGYVVVGLAGRTGQYVDNLTVLVAEPFRAAVSGLAQAGNRPTMATVTR